LRAPEPGVVCQPRRRCELGTAATSQHDDADAEGRAPAQRFERDGAGGVQDDEPAEAVGGPVIAPDTPVLTDAVVDLQGSMLDGDPHSEAVGDADAGCVGTAVGLDERGDRVGHVLGRQAQRPGCGRG
jgi:hypothetical protein